MGIFDGLLGNWIQIIDNENDITIENYGYDTGVVEGTTGNHCVKRVDVNKCWFKDETGKKPEKFNYTGIEVIDAIVKGILPGLYHFRCHCKEVPIDVVSIDSIQLMVLEGKINWLIKDKADWIKSFGYREVNDFMNALLHKTKEAYFYGNYTIVNHTKYGCKINLQVDIPGVNEKDGKVYKVKTNYMIFPNGKLKCNTLLGGWIK